MFMARTLGRTVEELADSMSGQEYGDWMALYAIERDEQQGAAPGAAGIAAPELVEDMDVREFLRRSGKGG